MIYCIPTENYPKENQFLEELSYKDENDFEWKVARVNNGFIIKYFGDEYFKDSTFEIELKSGNWVRVKNTNCIFFENVEFETFYHIRELLKKGYTDEIWESITDLFKERFENCVDILECEML